MMGTGIPEPTRRSLQAHRCEPRASTPKIPIETKVQQPDKNEEPGTEQKKAAIRQAAAASA